jgi:uncharacterized integral membrane protein (TIGR00698 family)
MLKVGKKTTILVAVGTAICGASAIAIASPVVKAEKEDTGRALIIVVLLSIIGALAYPFVQKFLMMPESIYAFFSAVTLHTTGAVKTAVSSFGKEVSDLALSIKLARTTLIIPVLAILALIFRKEQYSAENSVPAVSQTSRFQPLSIYIALVGFVLVGLLFSFVSELGAYVKTIKPYSAIFWTLALTSIGLTVDTRSLFKSLVRPAALGVIVWFGSIAIFLLSYWLIIV